MNQNKAISPVEAAVVASNLAGKAISEQTIRLWFRKGLIEGKRFLGRIGINRDSLESFVKAKY